MKDLAMTAGTLSGIAFERPIRNGQCYQWNLEHQIWDNTFIHNKCDSGNGDFLDDANLLYIETPVTLSKFQNMADQVLFEEYNIGSLVRTCAPALAPWLDSDDKGTRNDGYKNFELVIDLGFEATWIVPMINGIPYYKAVKKLPIAGKFLNSYLREIISFRHYNIVEEPVLVNAIKEQTCYVAEDFNAALNKLTRLKQNSGNLIDSDMSMIYILPNNKTDFKGYTIRDKSKMTQNELFQLKLSLDKSNMRYEHDNDSDDDDSGNDLANSQTLLLTDERFMIPELLFRPQLSGVHKAGLIQTIKSSLDSVPELLRPLLTNNIVCMGGTANLPGLSNRIVKDLDSEVPIEAETNALNFSNICEDKSYLSWYAGKSFFSKGGFDKIKITREEYNEFGAEYVQEKFGFKLMK
ncbi:hypothetical protein CANINC_000844 [Pichia inconspicua]|uniref:Uncharacterized protein n=1 Tax=Pichia inconspicua TaxID=52247 RepID=A0A4T0X4W0_9ASCO|nr:hypothetical protein CANINC_000844 [[Candida] inconspicua]